MRLIGSATRLLALLILLLLPSCVSKDNSQDLTNAPDSTSITDTSSTQPGDLPSSDSASPTRSAQATATRQLSTTPEGDWRDIPIMPEVSQHILEIYQDGQAQGRDPHSLSVIGDCQSTPYVFLGPFAIGELAPDSSENYLWDAFNQFEPSFNRWSVTSRGGFTAASILSPLQADPYYCKTGETPLTCEYRLNNPAIVFITLETWLDPNTIERYEMYLRQILDYVIGQGSIPILITKADSAELASGTPVINPVVVRLAHEYDIPVVNFWRAAQYLSNSGIDPERGNFHLSPEGYDLKNILALRVLYTVWQAIDQENTSANVGSVTPTSSPEMISNPDPALQVTVPECTGGCIFFATAASHDGIVSSQGVYAYNYNDKLLTSVLGEGFDLQDVSADGQRLLVNKSNFLYEINLTTVSSTLVSDSFFSSGKQDAYWNSTDTTPIFLNQSQPIQTDTGGAFNLFPSSRDGELYFESGSCTSKDYCQSSGFYRLNADQSLNLLDAIKNPVFSPDGKYVAFLNPAAATKDNYYHIGYLLLQETDRGIASQRVFYFPQEHGFMVYPDVRKYAFSPDGTKLFILYDIYSAYFERSLGMKAYILDITTGILYEYGKVEGATSTYEPLLVSVNSQAVWSPEGNKTLAFLTNVSPDSQYSIGIYQSILNTDQRLVPYDQGLLTSNDYFYITNIYWR